MGQKTDNKILRKINPSNNNNNNNVPPNLMHTFQTSLDKGAMMRDYISPQQWPSAAHRNT